MSLMASPITDTSSRMTSLVFQMITRNVYLSARITNIGMAFLVLQTFSGASSAIIGVKYHAQKIGGAVL